MDWPKASKKLAPLGLALLAHLSLVAVLGNFYLRRITGIREPCLIAALAPVADERPSVMDKTLTQDHRLRPPKPPPAQLKTITAESLTDIKVPAPEFTSVDGVTLESMDGVLDELVDAGGGFGLLPRQT